MRLPPPTLPSPRADCPGFAELLRRYLFFAWLFRDASRGSVLERAAAWRHNQACAHWLPVYMRRHLVLGSVLFGLGLLVEQGLHLPVFSSVFYVPGILTVHCNVVAAAAWLGLKLLPPPI